jgi:predicted transglutaminase-like cysteine proteinase
MVRLLGGAIAARRAVIAAVAAFACLCVGCGSAGAGALYASLGERTPTPPIGWVQFCQTYQNECNTAPLPPRDVVLSDKAWNDLKTVNDRVNHTIKPMTDMDHYGVIQWWRYPDDGAGACHSYALLKRRMLLEAGWPRTALLMTIVHEKDGEGHAVLTVKTDRGEFILDNLNEKILPWSETPYSYYKRQSQADPNVWVALDDPRDVAATMTSNLR